MYRSYSVSRFLWLLLADAVVISFCAAFFFVGKFLFGSFAENKEEAPVKLPVIMYHSIFGETPSEYIVTPEQVENDFRWLSENGYRTVTAEEVIKYTQGRGELPDKSVMITLDDGYYNNLTYLLPLLEKYDMNAIISVVGEYTDNNAACDPHVPCYSYLTWDDITLLSGSGRIEFGNHTYEMHSLDSGRRGCKRMIGESEEDYIKTLSEDITLLQSEFKDNIGITPRVFTYPFGAVCMESLPVLRENGFLMTLTCRESVNYITRDPECLYGIGRYNRNGLISTEEYMKELMEY